MVVKKGIFSLDRSSFAEDVPNKWSPKKDHPAKRNNPENRRTAWLMRVKRDEKEAGVLLALSQTTVYTWYGEGDRPKTDNDEGA